MKILQTIETPAWLLDSDIAAKQYHRFSELFEYATVAYAVKANPHPVLLERLHTIGAHFCVVSSSHLRTLLQLGVPTQRIIYSHPVKSPEAIQFALEAGVRRFCCDSLLEIEKIADFHIPTEIFIRVRVSSHKAIASFQDKFGASPEDALELMREAGRRELHPIGFTFHVGSQCLSPVAWVETIQQLSSVWKAVQAEYGLHFINLGGGFPVPYSPTQTPEIGQLSQYIRRAIETYLPNAREIVIEPGRAIAGPSACLLTSVIGSATRRDGNDWAYLDAGIFSGLSETLDGIQYPTKMIPSASGPKPSGNILNTEEKHSYLLAGPTCDPIDRMFSITTQGPLKVGDRILFTHIGAYGYTLETLFNGFAMPEVTAISLNDVGIFLMNVTWNE